MTVTELTAQPPRMPAKVPADPVVDKVPAGLLQARARQVYWDSVAAGAPLSGKTLGERFGRSPRWGRYLIADARGDRGLDIGSQSDSDPAAADVDPVLLLSGARHRRASGSHGTATSTVGENGSRVGSGNSGANGPGSGSRAERQTAMRTATRTAPPARAGAAVTRAMTGTPAAVPAAVAGRASTDARLVAWLGFLVGSVISVAANVLHTWLPATKHPPGWAPGIAPQIGSAVWPIVLLLAVEVLSRVHWPAGFWWALARYGGAGTVAIGSAVISYGHLHEVLLAWDYGVLGAAVGPLVLDGLMVVSGFALLAMSPRTPHHTPDRSADREESV